MREAIGGTWIFQIVIIFILLFTGFMCLSVNRSRAYSVKDQIIQTIQAYNGIDINKQYDDNDSGAMEEIIGYLKDSSYRTTGYYDSNQVDQGDGVGCFNRQGKSDYKRPVFCITKFDVSNEGCSDTNVCGLPSMVYYRVTAFYNLDLPIFHDLFNFRVVGDTKVIYGGLS